MNTKRSLLVGLLPSTFLAFSVLALGGSAAEAGPTIPPDTKVVRTGSGLRWCRLCEGREGGPCPRVGDRVRVHYTGWLADGTVFDCSRQRGTPADFVLGEVIPGWNEALQSMRVGERRKLTLPPALAYGEQGLPPAIPRDATLVYDVELLEVVSSPPAPEFRPADPKAQRTTPSGLKYEVLKEGSGAAPGPDEGFEMRYALWNSRGKLLQCSERTGETIRGRREDMALAVLREAAALLRPGARYRFEAPAALAFGGRDQGPDLPPDSVTVWDLEMVRVIRPLPVPEFSLPCPGKATTTASGLVCESVRAGTGRPARADRPVTVHYAGWLEDGTPFDSSYARGEPVTFPLDAVIPGWREGLLLMREGGACRVRVPAALAYGAEGRPPKIPANAALVFHVELIRVGP